MLCIYCIYTFLNLYKYHSKYRKIYFKIGINTFQDLNKYISKLEQIHFSKPASKVTILLFVRPSANHCCISFAPALPWWTAKQDKYISKWSQIPIPLQQCQAIPAVQCAVSSVKEAQQIFLGWLHKCSSLWGGKWQNRPFKFKKHLKIPGNTIPIPTDLFKC